MYWALKSDISGYKAKLKVIYIESGMQEIKNNARGSNLDDEAIVMEIRRKISALARLINQ